MYNHAPADYPCPICLAVQGIENDDTWIKQADIFYRDELVMGFISSKSIKGNEGHAVIVPLQHIENVYDLPEEFGSRIFAIAKRTAIAIKKNRMCDGINIAQFNEPAGDQHAFHYHLHVMPRFHNDHFHENLWTARRSDPEARVAYAEALRSTLNK